MAVCVRQWAGGAVITDSRWQQQLLLQLDNYTTVVAGTALWDLTPLFAEKFEIPYMNGAPSVLLGAHHIFV